MPKSIQAPPFQWPVRVYYEDTDAGGVVYHARYLHFMERARTEWLRNLGFEQDRLRSEQGVLFAVRKMTLDFVRPARFNQELCVSSRIIGNGRASIDFAQQVVDAADDHVYCRGTVNVACLDATRLRPARIPSIILQALMPSLNVVENGGGRAHGL
jgi:acyl-CoA thioester hydrolase